MKVPLVFGRCSSSSACSNALSASILSSKVLVGEEMLHFSSEVLEMFLIVLICILQYLKI